MTDKKLFFVDLEVGDVPKEFYQENGQREIDYTRNLIHAGVIEYLLVSKNRRHSYITFEVTDEQALEQYLDGFPLKPFFTIHHKEVMDLAEMVKQQN